MEFSDDILKAHNQEYIGELNTDFKVNLDKNK